MLSPLIIILSQHEIKIHISDRKILTHEIMRRIIWLIRNNNTDGGGKHEYEIDKNKKGINPKPT